jgi:hypothetical protein
MKNPLLLLGILTLTFWSYSNAQGPTINSSIWPQIGDTLNLQPVSTVNVSLGTTGANQVWDYSALQDTGSILPEYFLSPAATPYHSSYPAATLAAYEPGGGYEYDLLESGTLTRLGLVPDVSSFNFYTNLTLLEFPLTYGYSYHNSCTGIDSIPAEFNVYISGQDSLAADGYGTLKLPGGNTYDNVLRVRWINNETDSSMAGITTSNLMEIEYFSAQYGILLNLININSTAFNTKAYQYTKNPKVPAGITELNNVHFSMAPNPCSTNLIINTSAQSGTGETIVIYDMLGRAVKEEHITSEFQHLDVTGLSKGVYVVTVITNSWSGSKKLVIN